MEHSDRKSASPVIRRKPRLPRDSRASGQLRRGLRPLWLNEEAVRIAEQRAEDAGMPVAQFVESMLFEVCGHPKQAERSASRVKRLAVPAGRRVIQIGEARRRRRMS
jgi:hypothetical protein